MTEWNIVVENLVYKNITSYKVKRREWIKMKTEFLMAVGLILKDGENGKRIAGGADLHYSTKDLSWLDINGKEILIQTSQNNLFFKVKKVDVFTAFSGALNIGLTLEDDAQIEAISIGDKVYKILNR